MLKTYLNINVCKLSFWSPYPSSQLMIFQYIQVLTLKIWVILDSSLSLIISVQLTRKSSSQNIFRIQPLLIASVNFYPCLRSHHLSLDIWNSLLNSLSPSFCPCPPLIWSQPSSQSNPVTTLVTSGQLLIKTLQQNPISLSEKSKVLTMLFKDTCNLLTTFPSPLWPHLLPPCPLLTLFVTMLSLFPLIHQALVMPLPECSSTQHHAAHLSLPSWHSSNVTFPIRSSLAIPLKIATAFPPTPYLPFLVYSVQ